MTEEVTGDDMQALAWELGAVFRKAVPTCDLADEELTKGMTAVLLWIDENLKP